MSLHVVLSGKSLAAQMTGVALGTIGVVGQDVLLHVVETVADVRAVGALVQLGTATARAGLLFFLAVDNNSMV